MSEPEDVIVEAVHFATIKARAIWAKQHPGDDRLHLTEVHRRLELLVSALFEDAPAIGPAEIPPPLPLLARFASPLLSRARPMLSLSSTDGVLIRLPQVLDEKAGTNSIIRYRLLALEQAIRASRGTSALLPDGDLLLRDLYLLSESGSVDVALALLVPGFRGDLAIARADEVARRARGRMNAQESEVERLTLALLASDLTSLPHDFSMCETPAQSLAWATAEAQRIRSLPGRYRGVAPVELWGTVSPRPDATPGVQIDSGTNGPRRRPRTHAMSRRPRARESTEDEDDDRTGTFIVRADDPQESVEDPMGLQRPLDKDAHADPADLGDSLSDLREARLVRTPGAPLEILTGPDALPRSPVATDRTASTSATVYPEWDYRERRYHEAGAVVHEVPLSAGDTRWADEVLKRHGPLVRRVRRDFERLRPRREILRRQLDGAEVDVDAYVTTAADVRAGASPDARLYLADRRVRRDTAVFLLVDTSASTDSWVAGSRRVIDVEREGLLIVSEALAALGDLHAIFAFRGEGASRVELLPIKTFADPPGTKVRRRIGALEPDGYTRVGAAVRHATALVSRAQARQRVLLVLSDGRPNDVDLYEGRYGLEDTRRAFAEARWQGTHTFCLTVDREAPAYASRVFGEGGYAVLRHPERLPQVLVSVLRRLLRD